MKKIILTLFLICFVNYGLSQEGEESDDLAFFDIFEEEQEEIACEDLPETFEKYDQDRNLNQTAMENSLIQTVKTLRAISQQNLSASDRSLSELIDQLKEAISLSQENSYILLNKADNISYFLKDCTFKEEPDSKEKSD